MRQLNDTSIENKNLKSLNLNKIQVWCKHVGMYELCNEFKEKKITGNSLFRVTNETDFMFYNIILSVLLSKNKINELFVRLSDIKQKQNSCIHNYCLSNIIHSKPATVPTSVTVPLAPPVSVAIRLPDATFQQCHWFWEAIKAKQLTTVQSMLSQYSNVSLVHTKNIFFHFFFVSNNS